MTMGHDCVMVETGDGASVVSQLPNWSLSAALSVVVSLRVHSALLGMMKRKIAAGQMSLNEWLSSGRDECREASRHVRWGKYMCRSENALQINTKDKHWQEWSYLARS